MSASTWIAFALFTAAAGGAWALFAVLRVHVKGYEEYSNNLTWVTKVLFWLLAALTALGYVLVFTQDFSFREPSKTSSPYAEEAF